ncbi:MAG: hypothetical protein PVI88_00040 [Nitrosopumilaceae archaeon]|jgi:hypothetical protein
MDEKEFIENIKNLDRTEKQFVEIVNNLFQDKGLESRLIIKDNSDPEVDLAFSLHGPTSEEQQAAEIVSTAMKTYTINGCKNVIHGNIGQNHELRDLEIVEKQIKMMLHLHEKTAQQLGLTPEEYENRMDKLFESLH